MLLILHHLSLQDHTAQHRLCTFQPDSLTPQAELADAGRAFGAKAGRQSWLALLLDCTVSLPTSSAHWLSSPISCHSFFPVPSLPASFTAWSFSLSMVYLLQLWFSLLPQIKLWWSVFSSLVLLFTSGHTCSASPLQQSLSCCEFAQCPPHKRPSTIWAILLLLSRPNHGMRRALPSVLGMWQGDFGPYSLWRPSWNHISHIWELPDGEHHLQGVINSVTNFLKFSLLSFTLSLFRRSMAFPPCSSNSQWRQGTVYFLVHAFTGLVEASGIISSHS